MNELLREYKYRIYSYCISMFCKDGYNPLNAVYFCGWWINDTGFYKKYPKNKFEPDTTQDRYEIKDIHKTGRISDD